MEDIFKLSRHFLKTFNKPYQRYFIQQHPIENRFSIILGQRGIGKTTIIIQHILSKYNYDHLTREALYVPVDHFIVGKRKIYEIAEEFHSYGGKLICFDEIHKYANWSGELKSIYDSFPNLTIITSGSSALEIKKGSHDLSRRAIVYYMYGLSFREYIGLELNVDIKPVSFEDLLEKHEQLSSAIVKQIEDTGNKILLLFQDYLLRGYFPYFKEFDQIDHYHITLEQGIHTTIESDLLSIYPTLNGSSIKKIKKLLAIIANSVPVKPDLKKLKNLINIGDERTLKNYLSYLEDGGVILSFYRTGKKFNILEKPEKIYLNNPNEIYAISIKGSENIGNVRETFFASMLRVVRDLTIPPKSDFCVDQKYTFEIGGKNKTFRQIKDVSNSYLALDGIEIGFGNKIPLWMFGFLY